MSKQLLFYIPAMLICSRFWGLTGILAAGPVADTLAFILCAVLCRNELVKMKRLQIEQEKKKLGGND